MGEHGSVTCLMFFVECFCTFTNLGSVSDLQYFSKTADYEEVIYPNSPFRPRLRGVLTVDIFTRFVDL